MYAYKNSKPQDLDKQIRPTTLKPTVLNDQMHYHFIMHNGLLSHQWFAKWCAT